MTIIISLYSLHYHFCFPRNLMQLIISQTARCESQEYESTADDMRRMNHDMQSLLKLHVYTMIMPMQETGVNTRRENLQISQRSSNVFYIYFARSRTNVYDLVVVRSIGWRRYRSQRILRSQACLAYEIKIAITFAWNS
jgi:hypothetical protein